MNTAKFEIIVETSIHSGGLLITVPPELLAQFKILVSRGLNTWDHASPELKAFGDMVIVGYVTQDYEAQNTSKAQVGGN